MKRVLTISVWQLENLTFNRVITQLLYTAADINTRQSIIMGAKAYFFFF